MAVIRATQLSSGGRIGALASVLLAGTAMLVSAAVASAAPPFPDGATATPLVGSVIVANCATTPAMVGGRATLGGVTVGDPAGGRCTTRAAAADGLYSNVAGPLSLRFSADCDSGSGATGGGVEVPAGASVGGVLLSSRMVVTGSTGVVYRSGRRAALNVVSTTATSVTRSAIVYEDGTIVGRVVCGSP